MTTTAPYRVQFEPGFLEAFRAYYLLRVLLASTVFLVMLIFNQVIEPLVFGIITGLSIFVYLSIPELRDYLGRYFLPLTFVFAMSETLAVERLLNEMLFSRALLQSEELSGMFFDMQMSSPVLGTVGYMAWRVSPPTMFLLVFICWQYTFREVLLFSLSAALFDVLFPLDISVNPVFTPTFRLIMPLLRLIAFTLAGYLITRLVEAQRHQRRELIAARTKIAQYATTVEKLAVSRERNRLARELHDTLAHTLSAASVQLEAVNALWDVDNAHAHSLLQRSLETTRSGLTETRRALQDLRASPLDDLGLLLALQELGEITRQRSGGDVQMSLPPILDGLPSETEQTLYRVAQESLGNVVRHAAAKHVTLNLWREGGSLHLQICDDGMGFDVADVNDGERFGLRGMQERVLAVGGTLTINSQPGRGTEIHLTIKEGAAP